MIDQVCARGREHWHFAVPRDAVAAALGASEHADGAELDAGEVYLAAGCQVGLPDAIRAFETGYVARIAPMLRRQGFAADKIDEAIQRVRTDLLVAWDGEPMIRLCRYAGSGRLASLVRVSATRYARRDASGALPELLDHLPSDDASDGFIAGQLGMQFKDAFANVLTQCSSQEKLLLRMVFIENLTYREVAKLFSISKSTVCRQLVELERRMVKQLAALWRQKANAAIGDDLAEIIACELDLSFSRLLRISRNEAGSVA